MGDSGCCLEAILSRLSVYNQGGACCFILSSPVTWLKLTAYFCSDYENIKAAYEAMKNVAT